MALVSSPINDLLGYGVSDDDIVAYDGASSDQAGSLCTDTEWMIPHEGLRVIKLATDAATRCWPTTTMIQLLYEMSAVNNAFCDESSCHHDLIPREYKTIGLMLGLMLPPTSNHSIDLEFRWCLRMIHTASGEDDGECSRKSGTVRVVGTLDRPNRT